MTNKNNLYLAVFFTGLGLLHISPNYAADETAFERISHYPSMFPSAQPVITHYKITYHRHNDHTQENVEKFFQDSESTNIFDPEDINHFIQSGIKEFPLPTESNLLLEDLAWHKDKEKITKAIFASLVDKDLKSICYLGSVYSQLGEYENAKPWLFHAASKDDSDALWLLASLYHSENLLLQSEDSAVLERKLLEKSADLGNLSAVEALGPNYKK